MMIKRRKNYR